MYADEHEERDHEDRGEPEEEHAEEDESAGVSANRHQNMYADSAVGDGSRKGHA